MMTGDRTKSSTRPLPLRPALPGEVPLPLAALANASLARRKLNLSPPSTGVTTRGCREDVWSCRVSGRYVGLAGRDDRVIVRLINTRTRIVANQPAFAT
ncbi:hypothetical protein J2X36_002868 [Methylobacterium sp. BE186]|uniref:hypothetical protein n=1 Tax=Methylobacterium sp. BE186 TaxID=2817715 RepID=UPI0028621C82|nr:hypothetical protein [Methylobacterium sp. BE186]MDR7038112.1 hypothetical protein [Methylobacterium sp. BE186]